MGGQVVTFWIGQCGVQMANACWELFTLEHGISPDGKFYDASIGSDKSFDKFFLELGNERFIPRSLIIDLEPTVIDEIKLGKYRELFKPDSLIHSCEDAANNFARGFYSGGKEIIKNVVHLTRRTAEECESVDAFMIHHSFGGGTGSGFTSMLLEYLAVEFEKRSKIECGVFPSPTLSVSVVEPYNTVLALHTPMENANLAAFFENESIFHICSNNLDIQEINYTVINRVLAQVISGTTASLRYDGPMNANIIDFQTNLVPYPRIHFPLLSFYPVIGANKIVHENLSTKEITEYAFLKENQMTDVHPTNGAYMSCCLLFRGNINIVDVNLAIYNLRKTWSMPWVDWCPTGFKIGINYQPMLAIPGSGIGYSERSVSLLCNTTSFRSVISRINRKCMLLHKRKAFIHWYVGEGLEETEFADAIEDLLMLEKDYEIIESTVETLKTRTTIGFTKTKSISKTPTSTGSVESTSESSTETGNHNVSNITTPKLNEKNPGFDKPNKLKIENNSNIKESFQTKLTENFIRINNNLRNINCLKAKKYSKNGVRHKHTIRNNKNKDSEDPSVHFITNVMNSKLEINNSQVNLIEKNVCKIDLNVENLISVEVNLD